MPKIADLFAELSFKVDRLSDQLVDKSLRDKQKKLTGLQKTMRGLGRVGRSAATAVGGAISAGFVVATKDALAFDDAVSRFAVSADGKAGSIDMIKESVLDLAGEFGVAKEEILAGGAAFVEATGEGEKAADVMALLGKATIASGASTEELSKSLAALSQNLGVETKDFERSLAILVAGGKEGAVELRNLATELPSATALMQQFGATGVDAVQQLGAGLQIAKRGFGTAAEAATGFESLMGQIIARESELEKIGVRVFKRDSRGRRTKERRELLDITEDLAKVQAKSSEKFKEAFGRRKEALLALSAVQKNRGEWEAMSAEIGKATNLNKDFAAIANRPGKRAAKAMNDFKVAVARAFTPERIEAFANALTGALKIASFLVDKIIATGEFIGRFGGETVEKLTEGSAGDVAKTAIRGLSHGLPGVGVGIRALVPEAETRTSRREAAEREEFRQQFTAVATQLSQVGRGELPVSTLTAARGGVAGATSRTTVNAKITVNAPNADPKAVAREVVGEFMRRTARELADASK